MFIAVAAAAIAFVVPNQAHAQVIIGAYPSYSGGYYGGYSPYGYGTGLYGGYGGITQAGLNLGVGNYSGYYPSYYGGYGSGYGYTGYPSYRSGYGYGNGGYNRGVRAGRGRR